MSHVEPTVDVENASGFAEHSIDLDALISADIERIASGNLMPASDIK